VLIYDDVTSPQCVYIRLHRRRGSERLLSREELADWGRRMARMAATAFGPPFAWPDPTDPTEAAASAGATGMYDSSCSSSASDSALTACSSTSGHVGAAAAVAGGGRATACEGGIGPVPEDHPFYWTRLRGSIHFMMGTDWEDQPVINMRAVAAAAAAATPFRHVPKACLPGWLLPPPSSAANLFGSSHSAASAAPDHVGLHRPNTASTDVALVPRPLDWAAVVKAHSAKTGLGAFFASAAASKPAAADIGFSAVTGPYTSASVTSSGGGIALSKTHRLSALPAAEGPMARSSHATRELNVAAGSLSEDGSRDSAVVVADDGDGGGAGKPPQEGTGASSDGGALSGGKRSRATAGLSVGAAELLAGATSTFAAQSSVPKRPATQGAARKGSKGSTPRAARGTPTKGVGAHVGPSLMSYFGSGKQG
jgi:hypothetical protein